MRPKTKIIASKITQIITADTLGGARANTLMHTHSLAGRGTTKRSAVVRSLVALSLQVTGGVRVSFDHCLIQVPIYSSLVAASRNE